MKRCKSMPVKHHHYSSTSSTAGSINMSSSEGGSSLQMVLPVSGNINESGLLENKTMTPAGEEDMTQVFNGSASNQQAADVESDDEDEICPICLLEIVEGEDLVECVKGCHIELHRHCMEICKETSKPFFIFHFISTNSVVCAFVSHENTINYDCCFHQISTSTCEYI